MEFQKKNIKVTQIRHHDEKKKMISKCLKYFLWILTFMKNVINDLPTFLTLHTREN